MDDPEECSRVIRLRRTGPILTAVVCGWALLPHPLVGEATVSASATSPQRPMVASPLQGTVSVTGRGNGHGFGMSQLGAYGYAADHGWSAAQILDHYYGGTVTATVDPTTVISVRLLSLDGRQTAVVQRAGRVALSGDPGTTYSSLVARQVAAGSTAFEVWGRSDAAVCAPTGVLTGWSLVGVVDEPRFVLSGDDGSQSGAMVDLLGLCEPDGAVRYYRGDLRAVRTPDPRSRIGPGTVNEVRIEQYVRSVISKEMSPSWGLPANRGAAALEAQAVAARSYALASNYNAPAARTCDTTRCQVYAGAARQAPGSALLTSNEHPITDAAVTATLGQVRRTGGVNGPVALTMYAASSGGWTDQGAYLPFPAVIDEGDVKALSPGVPWANQWHRWTTTLTVSQVEQAWPQIGRLTGFTVVQRNGLGEWGGRVRSLRILGTAGEVTVTGDTFQSRMGLRSNWFTLDVAAAQVCPGTPEPPVTGVAAAAPPAGFSALTPVRLVDTRIGLGAPTGRLQTDCTIQVRPGLPDDATAAVVNITTVDVSGLGFITAYPCGTPRPWVSMAQSAEGRVTPSTAIVPLGADGSFCVYSPIPSNVVVDLLGYYAPSASGRFTSLWPARVYDSRQAVFGGPRRLPAGTTVPVQVTGRGGVPGSGVDAVSVTVHGAAGSEMGYVTAYPCDAPRPYTSINNVLPGQTVANHAQVRLDGSGRLCVFVSGSLDIMIDVTGWFGPSGATRYHAVQPDRAVDSRVGHGVPRRLTAGEQVTFPLAGRTGVPATGAQAVIATVTMVDVVPASFLTVHPCLPTAPEVSMVRNVPPRHSATAALVGLDAAGRWCVRAGAASDLLVDVVGWYG
jgi:SpoIID/LytB domain protein